MELISVLMSIYNEPLDYIDQAVKSILCQTYTNIELIIVVDNPSLESNIVEYLNQLPDNVVIIYNQENMGLAMSMNKALEVSHGKYIARMDSDDIAYHNRLSMELEEMIRKDADLVCSQYDVINEKGEMIKNNFHQYTNLELKEKLPYKNTIHHPTVIIRRDSIMRVGGYRDFPCSQDYDVWLRMYDMNMKFVIIEEALLQYRVRQESITQKSSMKQSLTTRYIRSLYRERKKREIDSYSKNNYEMYLRRHNLYNDRIVRRYEKNRELKQKIDSLREKKSIKKTALKVALSIRSPFHRDEYICFLSDKIQEIFDKEKTRLKF